MYANRVSIRDYFIEQARRRSRIELPDSFDPDFLRPMRVGPCFLTSGKSILRPDGEFVFVHTNDFAENILVGNNCFLCGCYPDGVEFNNEHVIPDWLLRYTGIANMSITLPNGCDVRYSSYKVRSCAQCNSFLSNDVEDHISRAIKGGFESLSEFLEQNPKLVFQWLCLIYYKVHFRDFSLRYNVDHREHDAPIGALYAWPNFHHIFCVSRSVLFKVLFSPGVIGTIKLFRLDDWERHGSYDYRDHWATDTMFVRIKDICIYVSFTDAEAVDHMMQNKFSRIPTHLNYIQSIEIFGDFVSAKMHFNQQHEFHSLYDPDQDDLRIIAEVADDFDWHDIDRSIRGSAQAFAFRPEFGQLTISGLSHETTFDEIATGEVSFFPEDGDGECSFVEHHPPDDPDYAKKSLNRAVDQEHVRAAFERLTKNFFEDD
mgnify:CR=1 FL=1